MIRAASSALSRSADVAGALVVGGLLTLLTWIVTPVWAGGVLAFPPLVVLAPLALAPALVVRGYFVRVVADGGATGNRRGAPSFVAWNELYRDGLKSTLLSALLLAPLAALSAVVALAGAAVGTGRVDVGAGRVGVGTESVDIGAAGADTGIGSVDVAPALALVERALGPDGLPAVVGAGTGVLVVVAAAYILAFAYVRPAALTAFAASGRLRDGLRPGRIAAVAGSGEYATGWVVAVATLGAGYALAAPFVPLAVGAAFVFGVRTVAHALYGRGAAGAVAFGVGEPAESAAQTASSASAPAGAGSLSAAADPSADRPDGGLRRSTPGVPVAVQTGRTVPLGNGRTPPTAEGDGDAAGFEWNVGGGPAGVDDDASGDGDAADGGFEWGAGAEPEDKS